MFSREGLVSPRERENIKAMFCRVCKFRVGFLMCYRTNRSSGRGIEVAQNLQKLRVGSVTLYPVPVLAPGYFHRPHRSPGKGFECATELTEVRVVV